MYPVTELNADQIKFCKNTISSNTFYMLVCDALRTKKPLSVIRMGDGEVELLKACEDHTTPEELVSIENYDGEWFKKLGCYGITKTELFTRLIAAANHCTYFAPSISGIINNNFSLHHKFMPRDRYADNFFVNVWTEEMKIALFKEAKHVLFIHRNLASADALQIRAKYGLDVKVTYVNLSTWQQAESVIREANTIDAPLVLFSGGPANKFIATRIATEGNIPKVVLDLGNASDYWLLTSLKDAAQGRR